MSSSWLGSWWNSASRLAPTSPASHTAYSTVQWPQSRLLGELGRRVLGVVDQQVDALAEAPHAVGDARPADRLLVVADVGDARRPVGDAVAERLADVGHAACSRRRSRRCGTWPPARGPRRGRGSRRCRSGTAAGRSSPTSTSAAVRPSCSDGRVHDELALLVEQRPEERQALDVVPVEVAEQARAAERHAGRAAQAEVAQPGAEVEQQRVLAGDVDGHAGRVAAVAGDLITMARGRAPDAMKPDQHAARRPPQDTCDREPYVRDARCVNARHG